MRVGIVRSDMVRGVYLADLSSHVQKCFSSAVPGQARNIRKPSDEKLLKLIKASPVAVAEVGTDTTASVNTTAPANVLKIRTNPQAAFSTITVTSGATTAKGTLVTDLNTGFGVAGLPLVASVVGTNQLQILSTATGQYAYIELDTSAASHSTLNPIVGFTPGIFQGATPAALLAALKAAVYTPTTFNVAAATITGVSVVTNTTGKSSFGTLPGGGAAFAAAVADLVAPMLVEGGDVLLSFAKGVLSVVRSTGYKFKGVTGQALYATANDGSTPFSFP